jgi:hypothetical protein
MSLWHIGLIVSAMPRPRRYDHRQLPFVQPPGPEPKPEKVKKAKAPTGPVWIGELNAVRRHVDRYAVAPSRQSDVARERELAAWWAEQSSPAGREMLSSGRRNLVDTVAGLIRDAPQRRLDEERARQRVRDEVAERTRVESRERMQPVVDAVAATQIEQAKRMLDSPYLLPGDREMLELRIANPSLSVAELARIADVKETKFRSRLRGALKRNELSLRGRHDTEPPKTAARWLRTPK